MLINFKIKTALLFRALILLDACVLGGAIVFGYVYDIPDLFWGLVHSWKMNSLFIRFLMVYVMLLVVIALASFLGMAFFQIWGRRLFIIYAGFLLCNFFLEFLYYGAFWNTGIPGAFDNVMSRFFSSGGWTSLFLDGVIFAMAFFSEVRDRFHPQGK